MRVHKKTIDEERSNTMAYDIAVSMETVAKDAIQMQTNMGECSVN